MDGAGQPATARAAPAESPRRPWSFELRKAAVIRRVDCQRQSRSIHLVLQDGDTATPTSSSVGGALPARRRGTFLRVILAAALTIGRTATRSWPGAPSTLQARQPAGRCLDAGAANLGYFPGRDPFAGVEDAGPRVRVVRVLAARVWRPSLRGVPVQRHIFGAGACGASGQP